MISKKTDKNILAQALCTKLTHNLAGKLGAIHNCLELINDKKGQNNIELQKKAHEILSDNVQKSIDDLKYYRYAYSIDSDMDYTSFDEFKSLIDKHLDQVKVKINYLESLSNIGNDCLKKIILNIISVITSRTSQRIELNIRSESKTKASIIVDSVLALEKFKELKGDFSSIDVFNAEQCYIYYMLKQNNYKLAINHDKTRTIFEITK